MERHQHAVVQILSNSGQVWVYTSHKPELLTTSLMVFGRESATFLDETISIASYCFQTFFSCQHRTTECCVIFLCFFGVRLDISMDYLSYELTLCRSLKVRGDLHAPAINLLENQICVLGCMLRPHARNGNELQTPGHR